MRKLTLLCLCSLFLFVTNCKNTSINSRIDGTIVRKNVDGCTWLIQLKDNSLLEPVNLSDFKVTLTEGQKVVLKYAETEAFSSCMMGKMVRLTYLKDK